MKEASKYHHIPFSIKRDAPKHTYQNSMSMLINYNLNLGLVVNVT